MGVQLSLEDPQSSLKWLPPSKPKEILSPAPTRRKQLPWNRYYRGYPPMPTILNHYIFFAQIVNHYVKLSCHQIPRTFSIHNSINSISSSIFIQFIPYHSANPGNEPADKAAKEATTIATNAVLPVSFSSSKQVINGPSTDECAAQVYQHQKTSRDSKQSRTEKMTYCLLVYDLVTIHLSISIFIGTNQLKIQFARHAASRSKTSITGFVSVLQMTP